MKPTHQQAAITHSASRLQDGEVLKVLAAAGAGKTSTLKMVAKARQDRGLYMAFNKSIATEAKHKLAATRCSAATMHALAFRVMRDEMEGGPQTLNARAVIDTGLIQRRRVRGPKGWGDYRVGSAVARTVAIFCASADTEISRDHGRAAVVESVGDPDFISTYDRKKKAEEALRYLVGPVTDLARDIWDLRVQKNAYDHDMYLKMIDLEDHLRRDAFRGTRYLMVDEAQDLNPVQRSILLKSGLPLIAVGDPYQAIYSWRGAEDALSLMDGESLHLTQSFRFGNNIAKIARYVLEHHPDGGPDERVTGVGPGSLEDYEGPRGMVVCRTNVGMLEEAIDLIEQGKTVHIDKIEDLVGEVTSAAALREGDKREVKDPTIRQFATWDELKESADAGDTHLTRLVNLVEKNRVDFVKKLAAENCRDAASANISVCTAHRSKGLEAPNVRMGNDFEDLVELRDRYEKSAAKSEKHAVRAAEEFNLVYVAATRGMLRTLNVMRILKPVEDPIVKEAREAREVQKGAPVPAGKTGTSPSRPIRSRSVMDAAGWAQDVQDIPVE